MIRGAVLHLLGEQPLLADLQSLPGPGDTCVVCTNVRLTSGKRPPWVDRKESWFMFPMTQLRFVEIPPEAMGRAAEGALIEREPGDIEQELELDEDLLRRIRDT